MTTSHRNNNKSKTIIIKKYANRRLYDTNASAYVTLDHIARLITEKKDVAVQDAKTGEDLTHSVLLQIIFEQENHPNSMLSANFLRKLIQTDSESSGGVLASYLELSMESFFENFDEWKQRLTEQHTSNYSKMTIQSQFNHSIDLHQARLDMVTKPPNSLEEDEPETSSSESINQSDVLNDLQKQMSDMQQQIELLAKKT